MSASGSDIPVRTALARLSTASGHASARSRSDDGRGRTAWPLAGSRPAGRTQGHGRSARDHLDRGEHHQSRSDAHRPDARRRSCRRGLPGPGGHACDLSAPSPRRPAGKTSRTTTPGPASLRDRARAPPPPQAPLFSSACTSIPARSNRARRGGSPFVRNSRPCRRTKTGSISITSFSTRPGTATISSTRRTPSAAMRDERRRRPTPPPWALRTAQRCSPRPTCDRERATPTGRVTFTGHCLDRGKCQLTYGAPRTRCLSPRKTYTAACQVAGGQRAGSHAGDDVSVALWESAVVWRKEQVELQGTLSRVLQPHSRLRLCASRRRRLRGCRQRRPARR